ncbi:MAG TPA: dienelactone hydrolase family protein [Candidatus Lustribacter sp.]|nr:dienelactone hydrolase family protein [Candidatus Lustribacter sp.]
MHSTVPLHLAPPSATAEHLPAGIIVLQDAFGYNSYLEGIARRFNGLGFTTVIPELFHRTGGTGVEYDDPRGMEAVRSHMRALDVENVLLDVQAAYARLLADGIPPERIAVIGWCRGGQGAFFANAHLPLGAAISMYGNRIAPDLLPHAQTQHGRILMIWAGTDPFVPAAERRAVADALTAAGKLHDQAVFSGAEHGFFAPFSYHELAARVSWSMSIEFLRATGVLVRRDKGAL